MVHLSSSAAPGVTKILGNAIQLQRALGTRPTACVALGSLQRALIMEVKSVAQSLDIGTCSHPNRLFCKFTNVASSGNMGTHCGDGCQGKYGRCNK